MRTLSVNIDKLVETVTPSVTVAETIAQAYLEIDQSVAILLAGPSKTVTQKLSYYKLLGQQLRQSIVFAEDILCYLSSSEVMSRLMQKQKAIYRIITHLEMIRSGCGTERLYKLLVIEEKSLEQYTDLDFLDFSFDESFGNGSTALSLEDYIQYKNSRRVRLQQFFSGRMRRYAIKKFKRDNRRHFRSLVRVHIIHAGNQSKDEESFGSTKRSLKPSFSFKNWSHGQTRHLSPARNYH